MGGGVSVSPKTEVSAVSGNSSNSNHSVKDSTNTEISIEVTTSFCFLLLSFLTLLLVVVYYLWSKYHHRVLHSRIENLSYLTGHHPEAQGDIPLREIVTSKPKSSRSEDNRPDAFQS